MPGLGMFVVGVALLFDQKRGQRQASMRLMSHVSGAWQEHGCEPEPSQVCEVNLKGKGLSKGEVFAAFFAEDSKQVSQRLLPGAPPTTGQHGRQSVLCDKFLRIPSQNGCCGSSVRLLPSLHSQETQVSRKAAGWRSRIEVLQVFVSSQCRKDQTKHSCLGITSLSTHARVALTE